MKKHITLLIAIICLPYLLSAWGENGHRIVAQICYDNLSPEARQMVDKTLGDNYLTQVANWPDYIKSEKNWNFAKPWHYMTVTPYKSIREALEGSAKDPEINNVIEAIELMRSILNNDAAAIKTFQQLMDDNHAEPLSGSIHATALSFLIHFIGDVHQPMHVGKNKDYGGNKIKVLFFSEESNLHAVWDTRIIENENLSFTEFSSFVEKHIYTMKESQENAPITQWAEESVTTREDIYNTLYDFTDRTTGLPNFSYKYQHDYLPMVEERLGLAGYRAAAMLNGIWGKE